MSSDPFSPASLSPDDRLGEIASILSRGVLRLRKRPLLLAGIGAEESGKKFPTGLDVPADFGPDAIVG